MKKVKIFRSDDAAYIEKNINTWLAENQFIIINNILQSESKSESYNSYSITITIFYTDAKS